MSDYTSSEDDQHSLPAEEEKEETDHLSRRNIIIGKRKRSPPLRYSDPDYCKLMLEDVPRKELYWALEDEVSDIPTAEDDHSE